jgi:outer membrane protein assembly factor BamB
MGEGAQAVVEQLDPTTLATHSERDLPVKDALYPSPPIPVLTTVGGPLRVAAGQDIWALNPSTGVTETEFDTGNQINSMSTSPDGTLLYTSGVVSNDGGFKVTEYDAHTGEQLNRSDQQFSVGAGAVSATNGGVWVSYRTGMAGPALELSSEDLSKIAPPNDLRGSFGGFDQIMGVGSDVSEGVLWLTSIGEITCADPRTSVVRVSETVSVSDPIAVGGLLYALPPSGGVVVITPPKTCFGR